MFVLYYYSIAIIIPPNETKIIIKLLICYSSIPGPYIVPAVFILYECIMPALISTGLSAL